MIYRNLGNTGLKVSVLSYGAWVTFDYQVGVPKAKEILQTCMDSGVNFFDNAETYASGRAEEIMGQAIKELGWSRSQYVITTKLFWGPEGTINAKGLSRKHLREGCAASLKRLQLDYVDVLYCHRPDEETPMEEVVRGMNWLIDWGQALYWGTSEWSAQQLQEAWQVAERLRMVGPCVEQPEYNMFKRHKVEVEYLPLYRQYGLGLTTWSPLASGILTGKYSQGQVPNDTRMSLERYKDMLGKKLSDTEVLARVDRLKSIADELGCTQAQLALAWTASYPHVSSVITGASKVEQVVENMKAVDFISKVSPEVRNSIESILQNKPQAPVSYRS